MGSGHGVEPLHAQEREEIKAVVLYPIMDATFVCALHATGGGLGDALGKDCMVLGTDTTRASGRWILSLFEGDGLENEDWFGWGVSLLAPYDGTVKSVQTSTATNQPGKFAPVGSDNVRPASEIEFVCNDGVHVIYAHPRNIQVQPGDSVEAGDVVAEIGNNGVSKAPHIHIGAWKGDTPLQIRFDLRALGELRSSN